jgi:hypothetical protein
LEVNIHWVYRWSAYVSKTLCMAPPIYKLSGANPIINTACGYPPVSIIVWMTSHYYDLRPYVSRLPIPDDSLSTWTYNYLYLYPVIVFSAILLTIEFIGAEIPRCSIASRYW